MCNLESTSLMNAGSLYIFDKHLAYHNAGGESSYFFGSLPPVKMIYPYAEVAEVRVKEEYVTEPGVVVMLKNGTKHWWGGMMFPTAVCEAINNAWKVRTSSRARGRGGRDGRRCDVDVVCASCP